MSAQKMVIYLAVEIEEKENSGITPSTGFAAVIDGILSAVTKSDQALPWKVTHATEVDIPGAGIQFGYGNAQYNQFH